MNNESPRETAEQIAIHYAGLSVKGRLNLIAEIEAAVDAERERGAKIAETHTAADCNGRDCGVSIAAAIRGSTNAE